MKLTPSNIGLWSFGAVQNTVSFIISLNTFPSKVKLCSLDITGNSGYSLASYPFTLNSLFPDLTKILLSIVSISIRLVGAFLIISIKLRDGKTN